MLQTEASHTIQKVSRKWQYIGERSLSRGRGRVCECWISPLAGWEIPLPPPPMAETSHFRPLWTLPYGVVWPPHFTHDSLWNTYIYSPFPCSIPMPDILLVMPLPVEKVSVYLSSCTTVLCHQHAPKYTKCHSNPPPPFSYHCFHTSIELHALSSLPVDES